MPRLLRRRAGGGAADSVAAFMLGRWQDPEQRDRLLAMLRAAVTDEEATQILRDVVEPDLLGAVPLGSAEDDEAYTDVALLGSHVLGLALLRHIVELPVLRGEDVARLAAILERTSPADRVDQQLGDQQPVEQQLGDQQPVEQPLEQQLGLERSQPPPVEQEELQATG